MKKLILLSFLFILSGGVAKGQSGSQLNWLPVQNPNFRNCEDTAKRAVREYIQDSITENALAFLKQGTKAQRCVTKVRVEYQGQMIRNPGRTFLQRFDVFATTTEKGRAKESLVTHFHAWVKAPVSSSDLVSLAKEFEPLAKEAFKDDFCKTEQAPPSGALGVE